MSQSNYPYGYHPSANMGSSPAPGQWHQGQGGAQASGLPYQGSAYPGYGYAPGHGAAQAGYGDQRSGYGDQRQTQSSSSFLNFGNDRFVKGLLIGAAATYLITNESVQRTVIKGVVQIWSALQGGIEEVKERFHDAEAELQHAAHAKTDASGE